MMSLYYVKTDMHGVAAGRVEHFRSDRAAMMPASLEAFDPQNKKHAAAKERQEREAEDNRLRAEALLKEERENPLAARAREETRRKAAEAEDAKRGEARRKEMAERDGKRTAA